MNNSLYKFLFRFFLYLLFLLLTTTVNAQVKLTPESRIVSGDGTISEILCGLGLEKYIVGVDITSSYPASLEKLPKIGHNRTISTEGIISLKPNIVVLSDQSMIKPEVISQLESTGKKVIVFKQEFSFEGTKKLIQTVANTFGVSKKAEPLIKKLDADLAKLPKKAVSKKILFIYARGTGTLMVSGEGTSVDKMIQLSGNQNAGKGFQDFKPLTSEALLAANPDVLLLFDSGLNSVGGTEGLLKLPGIAQTNAGKNKKVIAMDGLLLMGFGPRVGKAAAELASKSN